MAKIFIEESTLSAIGNSIRAKTGKTNMIPPLSMPTEIESIQTDGGGSSSSPVSSNEVTFYDYDGTVVASYSLAEAQTLTSLPDGPTHDGLTFQGWNWSLENVNALTRPMNIGAMYITDDGKTRLYIHIADKARSTVPLYLQQTVDRGVTIDWGDGSAMETLTGTGTVNMSHAYGAAGDFTISLTVNDGCTLGFGHGLSSYCVMGSTNNDRAYCNMLQKVEIGSGVTNIGDYAFSGCYSLSSITIPDGVTSIGDYAFSNCRSLSSITILVGVTSIGANAFLYCTSLSSITIPDGVTSIESNAFNSCYSLPSIIIPDGVTNIGDYAFSGCYSLSSITIPDGVTSIGASAFSSCYSVAAYHLKPTTPPTLLNQNAFKNIPSDCIIYVPQGSLEAYKTATNWATYASYMQEKTT